MEYKDLKDKALQFRKEMDWERYHNPKDLALALSVEASELMEVFLWKENKDLSDKNLRQIEEEMADVFIYLMYLADNLGVDLLEISGKKLEENKKRWIDGWSRK